MNTSSILIVLTSVEDGEAVYREIKDYAAKLERKPQSSWDSKDYLNSFIISVLEMFVDLKNNTFVFNSSSPPEDGRDTAETQLHERFESYLSKYTRSFHSSTSGRQNPGCLIPKYILETLQNKTRLDDSIPASHYADFVLPHRERPEFHSCGDKVVNTIKPDSVIVELKTVQSNAFPFRERSTRENFQEFVYKSHLQGQLTKTFVWWDVYLKGNKWRKSTVEIYFYNDGARKRWLNVIKRNMPGLYNLMYSSKATSDGSIHYEPLSTQSSEVGSQFNERKREADGEQEQQEQQQRQRTEEGLEL